MEMKAVRPSSCPRPHLVPPSVTISYCPLDTPKGYKMRVCSVPNCNSKQSSKLSLFKVPPNGLNRNKWKDFLTKCGVSFWDDQRDYRVCERHFQSYEVVDMDHRRQLVRGSYPTLDNNNKVSLTNKSAVQILI